MNTKHFLYFTFPKTSPTLNRYASHQSCKVKSKTNCGTLNTYDFYGTVSRSKLSLQWPLIHCPGLLSDILDLTRNCQFLLDYFSLHMAAFDVSMKLFPNF